MKPSYNLSARRRNQGLCIALAGAILFPYAAPGVVVRHDRDLSLTIEKAESFEMAVRVGGGSGTLIAPQWVITAAHVARGLSPFSRSVDIGDSKVPIRQIVYHPDSRPDGPRPPRTDLALIQLETAADTTPNAELYNADSELGKRVLVLGYGDYGRAGKPLTRSDGRRRGVSNIVHDVNDRHIIISFEAPPDGTEIEGVGAPGDSGGPLLLLRDNQIYLVGVSSVSMGRPGQYGLRDHYVRVSKNVEWIRNTINRPAESTSDIQEPRSIPDDGFPDTPTARLVQRFLQSYNEATEASLVEFSAKRRISGARRDRSDTEWAAAMKEAHSSRGDLKALQYATTPRGAEVLLQESKSNRRWILRLLIQERDGVPRLDGQRFMPFEPIK